MLYEVGRVKPVQRSKMKQFLAFFVASFSLGVAALTPSPRADVIAYTVRSEERVGDDNLYLISMTSGNTLARISPVGYTDVTSLALQPGTGALFGFDDFTNQ